MSSENEEDEGIHFDPTEQELIQTYLIPKLRGEPCEDEFIEMKDVYAREPWLLDHTNDPFFKKNQWYYFVTRTQVSEKKIGCGKYAKRRITGDNNDGIDRGSWTATKRGNIIDEKTREIIGVKQSLTFSKSDQKNKKKQKRGDGTCATVPGSESSWIMKEFTLPPKNDEFQRISLCRIKEKKNTKKKDYHHQEASTSDYNHHLHHEVVLGSYSEHQPIIDHESVLASSSEQQPINDHEYVLPSYSEYQPINDHVLTSYSEHQPINNHESFYSEQQPVNDHESVLASYSEYQPINDHVLASYSEYQPINDHVLASYSEYQPINDHVLASYSEYQPINDHVLASYSEYQSINDHEFVLPSYVEHQPIYNHESSYSEQQPINDHESVLASYTEYQRINDLESVRPSYLEQIINYESVIASYSEQQPINDHESVLASYSEQQPINDHYEYVLHSYSEQQPLNETFHHYPECLIDNESAKVNERTREHNALEKSETLGSEEDNQVHINAPLDCLGHNSSLVTGSEQEVGETGDWVQEFANSLLAPNGSDVLAVEEDQDWLLDVPQLP